MPKNTFLQRKKSILAKSDKSSKGEWDKKIISLCNRINSLENYYTTSSCSGRIVIMFDKEKKSSKLFIKVYHDLLIFNQLKDCLNIIARKKVARDKKLLNNDLSDNNSSSAEKSGEAYFRANNQRALASEMIKFKQEPCILHVACRTLEDAQDFYDKARLAGWKKHGIIASKGRFVVEINGTDKLEFPIINKGKILVNDEFLKVVVKKSNENLKKNWEKIYKLEKLFE